MSKKIYLEADAREGLFRGIEIMYKSVSKTLGPMGRPVIIDNGATGLEEAFATRDGVTVAKSLNSNDPIENTAMQIMKKVCVKMDDDAGDGTTTTTIFTYHLIKQGFEDTKNAINIISYKLGMEACVSDFLKFIDNVAIKEMSTELLIKIATISANNDKHLGKMIGEAVDKAGKYGKVNLVESNKSKSEYKNIDGFVVDLGLADQSFGIDPKTNWFIAEKTVIMLHNGKITAREEWLAIMAEFDKQEHSLVVIAQDFSTEVMNLAKHANILFGSSSRKVCLVKNGMRENEFANIYSDIEVYTSASSVSEFTDRTDWGLVSSITIKPGYMIIGESLYPGKIKDHKFFLEDKLKQDISNFEKDNIKKRISRFEDGIVTFYVGGNSDIETKERFHRAQDSINACYAAREEGIVIGGGQTFLKFYLEHFSKAEQSETSYDLGYLNVIRALASITEQLYETSSKKINLAEIENSVRHPAILNEGYDFKEEVLVDMINQGIVDPAKVVKNAIVNAVSVAATILTTDCVIIES